MIEIRCAKCPACAKTIRLKVDGTIRPHGHPARRCAGGGFEAARWPSISIGGGWVLHIAPAGGAQ